MAKQEPTYGSDNPHPLSTRKTKLIWEEKYDEYGNRRKVNIAGCAKVNSILDENKKR